MRCLKHLLALTRHLLYIRDGELCKCEMCSYINHLGLNTYTLALTACIHTKKKEKKRGKKLVDREGCSGEV